jgi:nucleoside-diphosphate-sugar epimerase
VAGLVASFPGRSRRVIEAWVDRLAAWRTAGKRVAIWGSGSKGVSFLTTVPDAAKTIEYAVDINPYRQGYFMPGTGHKIVAPEQLRDLKPDAVIVMNRIYVPEITRTLDSLALTPEIAAL